MSASSLEAALWWQLRAAGLPEPEREYRFAPPRRWRLDFYWPAARLACEVDGAVFVAGRHTTGTGYTRDCEKLNAAALAGLRVLRVTRAHVEDGQALDWIRQGLEGVTA